MIVSPETSAVSGTTRVQIQNATFCPGDRQTIGGHGGGTPDAQTVIIGGMMQTQKAPRAKASIHLLATYRGWANLFKRRSRAVDTELLIFLNAAYHSGADGGCSRHGSRAGLNRSIESAPRN